MGTTTVHSTTKMTNGKATTKATPVVAAPKKASAATPAAAGAPKTASTDKRAKKLPPARKYERKLARLAFQLSNIMKKTAGWNPVTDLATAEAVDSINSAVTAFQKKLPDDFTPPTKKGGGGGRALEAGILVQIRDKVAEKWAGVLEKGEMANLTVVASAQGKVRVKTSEGVIIMLPRGHVVPMKSDEGGSEEEDA